MSKVLVADECGPYQCRANDLATQRDAFKSDAAALRIELEQVRSDLAAAREDVARMDRLSRSSVVTFTRVRQSECVGDMVEFFDGKSTYTGKTPRAAIDSARAGGGK